MIQVTINKRRRLFPQTWEDLAQNKADLIYILNLFFCELTSVQLLSAAAIRFMNLSRLMEYRVQQAIKTHPEEIHTQTAIESIARASELITFIVNTPPAFAENQFPVLQKKYYTTQNLLRDTQLWEYQLAEDALREFYETKNPDALTTLCAIIYRPRKPFSKLRKLFGNTNPDTRVKFNDHKIEKYKQTLKNAPVGQRYACLLWFATERNKIVETYKYLFNQTQTSNIEGRGWLDVILMMTTAGNEDIVATTKLSIVLERLAYNHREALKLKEKTNSSTSSL